MNKQQETMLKYGFAVLGVLLLVSVYMSYQTNQNINFLAQAVLQQGGGGTGTAPSPTPTQQPNQPAPSPTADVSPDDDATLGDEDAPVHIISFEDYQCPFCQRAFQQSFPQIKSNYIDTGKVKYTYRDFPLSFHPQAQSAAEAAECAGEQGKYWEYHDKLYNNQQSLGTSSYKQWAADLGLDTQQFNDCVDSRKYQSEVQQDFNDGQAAGVSGTPTFFINGKKIVGAQPYSAFEQAIEAELSG